MMGPPTTVQGGVSAAASGPRIAAASTSHFMQNHCQSALYSAHPRAARASPAGRCSAACLRLPQDRPKTANSRRVLAHQASLRTPAECMTAPVLRNAMQCAGSVLSQASLATLSCYLDGFTHHLLIKACRRREPPGSQPKLRLWSRSRGNSCTRADRICIHCLSCLLTYAFLAMG
jgi:hypothetical protein